MLLHKRGVLEQNSWFWLVVDVADSSKSFYINRVSLDILAHPRLLTWLKVTLVIAKALLSHVRWIKFEILIPLPVGNCSRLKLPPTYHAISCLTLLLSILFDNRSRVLLIKYQLFRLFIFRAPISNLTFNFISALLRLLNALPLLIIHF